jgi:hypothetical protein
MFDLFGGLLQPTHLIILAVLLALYLVPVLVARSRKCSATAGIAIINIFLGWTFLGWVVALTWAAIGKPRTA